MFNVEILNRVVDDDAHFEGLVGHFAFFQLLLFF